VSLLTAGAKAAILSGTRRVAIADLQDVLRALERSAGKLRTMRSQGLRLARLLLPDNVRDGLTRHSCRPLAVVHDREASRVPWECLAIDSAFPALGAGLSRRYAGDGLSAARAEAVGQARRPLPVLVATDPTGDLPGATLEREALQALLHEPRTSAKWLAGVAVTRQAVLAALRSGDYAALHFAGHAYFDATHPERSGLVCARGEILRGSDLTGIERLPALVFLNACEAARVRRGRTARSRDQHAGDGGSIAEALLDGGVANYLGTYWPVGDSAALVFARELYAALLDGCPLGEAVLGARRAVHAHGSADWANYLHFGSPDLVLWPA
jgi:CHAT domain-containing protein